MDVAPGAVQGGRIMIVYCDADDCKWNEDGKCKGPVQPAGHTALYIRQNWQGWQQRDDFKDKAEEES